MTPQSRNALIFWGAILVIGAGVGGYFGIDYLVKSSKVKPFNNRIAEYSAAFTRVAPVPPDPNLGGFNPPMPGGNSPGGYVVGKVIPIDMKAKPEVDWIYFELPADLKPAKPEDVGTVAQLH